MAINRTGLLYDPRFLAHMTGDEAVVITREKTFHLSPAPHPSSSFIIQRTKEFLDGSGLSAHLHTLSSRAATLDEITTYHTQEYVAGMHECAVNGPMIGPFTCSWGFVDEDTVISPGSYEAALYSVGGALNAVQATLNGEVHNAYALLRPPGHHAMSNQALGFCMFNNVALAAHYARRTFGVERIMIIDWDVHHGNGTQDAFYSDPGVLFVSLHQENWFPGHSGTVEDSGSDKGIGYTVNVPLPAGTGDRGYLAAFDQLIAPLGQQYRPELILVSNGVDACWLDPLAQMMMTMDGYRQLTMRAVALAEELCGGRIVLLHEGGYSVPYVPYCTAAIIEALSGIDLGIVDLYATSSELARCQEIYSPATQDALQAARETYMRWWKL